MAKRKENIAKRIKQFHQRYDLPIQAISATITEIFHGDGAPEIAQRLENMVGRLNRISKSVREGESISRLDLKKIFEEIELNLGLMSQGPHKEILAETQEMLDTLAKEWQQDDYIATLYEQLRADRVATRERQAEEADDEWRIKLLRDRYNPDKTPTGRG